jgi:hypothetical protein
MLSGYHQFLIALVIVGYFLANILDGFAEGFMGQASIPNLDYILFAVLVALIIMNWKNLEKFLKGKK